MASSSRGDPQRPAKRQKTLADLAALKGVAKGGLATVLHALHEQGLLTDSLVRGGSTKQYQRGIQSAIEVPLITSYGPVVQEMPLPIVDHPKWYYINPLALVAHLCTVSATFFSLLVDAFEAAGRKFRIVIYIDEIDPGNPLRPDKGRTLQAIYWTFADLPRWFLHVSQQGLR